MNTPIHIPMSTRSFCFLSTLMGSYLSLAGQGAESQVFSRTSEAVGKKPNIVVFLVDDMGWQDTSVPFAGDTTALNRLFRTPQMDRFASQGVKFTQAYAHSVSSPSRCSLLTGSHAARHGVTNWTLRHNVSTDTEDGVLTHPQWSVNGIAASPGVEGTFFATMLPALLRQSGYHTIHCGKAHFGAQHTPGEDPLSLGFEVNIAGHAAGGLASYLGEERYGHDAEGKAKSPFSIPGLEKYWDTETFATEALTLEAIAALENHRKQGDGRPFFLHLSHYAVHIPFDRDPRFYDAYVQRGVDPNDAAYAALVEGMDKSLGDLMDYLERTGEMDRTFIVFLSDNGGLAASDYWRTGEVHTQNAPLFSGKGSLHEGGVRIPMMIYAPMLRGKEAGCSEALVQIEDLFPTLAELAGAAKFETAQEVDGQSLLPILRGERDEGHRTLYWHYPHNWGLEGPGINFSSAIRHEDWKLIHNYRTGKSHLYYLPDDLGEQTDLSAQYLEVLSQLQQMLSNYLRKMGAKTPIAVPTGLSLPYPDGGM